MTNQTTLLRPPPERPAWYDVIYFWGLISLVTGIMGVAMLLGLLLYSVSDAIWSLRQRWRSSPRSTSCISSGSS